MSDWQKERQARDEARRRVVLQLPTVALTHHTTLEPPREADRLVTAAVGPDGHIYALWSSPGGAAQLASQTVQPGWATFPDPRTAQPVAATVTGYAPEPRVVARMGNLELAHPMIQPLPAGRVLLVGARASWRPEGPDRNAVVIDQDGRQLREATLGDGIESIQTTPSGDVWVGYFDEGVYGNFGWNGPGPAPIGQAGIARFDSDLIMQWEFPPHVDNPWGSVDDCYALNVVGEVAWACYYSDFPVVRIDGGRVSGWRNTVRGARALAVDDRGSILLAGGYGPERDRLVQGRLSNGELEVINESRLTLPNGAELPPQAIVIGRGTDLFVIAGRDCYRATLS